MNDQLGALHLRKSHSQGPLRHCVFALLVILKLWQPLCPGIYAAEDKPELGNPKPQSEVKTTRTLTKSFDTVVSSRTNDHSELQCVLPAYPCIPLCWEATWVMVGYLRCLNGAMGRAGESSQSGVSAPECSLGLSGRQRGQRP